MKSQSNHQLMYSIYKTSIEEKIVKLKKSILINSALIKSELSFLTANRTTYHSKLDVNILDDSIHIHLLNPTLDYNILFKYKGTLEVISGNKITVDTKVINYSLYALLKLLRVKQKLEDLEQHYSILQKINVELYSEILLEFNKNIMIEILKGFKYNLKHCLGTIFVEFKRRNFNKKVVDWGKSNKLKAQLIEEGYTPKSLDNPNGQEWLLYRTDNGNLWLMWVKIASIIKHINKDIIDNYSFIPTQFVNGKNRNNKELFYSTFKSIDEITNSNLIGNVEKLQLIRIIEPNYISNYKCKT